MAPLKREVPLRVVVPGDRSDAQPQFPFSISELGSHDDVNN